MKQTFMKKYVVQLFGPTNETYKSEFSHQHQAIAELNRIVHTQMGKYKTVPIPAGATGIVYALYGMNGGFVFEMEDQTKMLVTFLCKSQCGPIDVPDWRPYQEKDEGSEHNVVEVTKVNDRHFILECTQYYGSGGVLKVEITQHFDRAMNTLAKLLDADAQQEDADCVRYHALHKK